MSRVEVLLPQWGMGMSEGTPDSLIPYDEIVQEALRAAGFSEQGTFLADENLTCLNRIPAGHKLAACALAKGAPVAISTRPGSP